MPSSLAAQLAQAVSLNAPLLSETARKKHRATSYLFSSSTAQTEDLASNHALALNALAQLRLIYPAFRELDSPDNPKYQLLFSQRAKETDRTLLAKDEAKAVDNAVKFCLRILGPCLLDAAAGKVIEWLVRRFRVNEFNVPDVLALFLPYHESPHFAKMVSILQIEQNSPFQFLAAFKQTAKPLPRAVLADVMFKSVDLARFVVSLQSDAYNRTTRTKAGLTVYRTLLAFNLATLLEYITRADEKNLDASTLSFLLPAILSPLQDAGGIPAEDADVKASTNIAPSQVKDGILGSYVLLSALSQKVTFTSQALSTIVSSMTGAASNKAVLVDSSQVLTAIISVLVPQPALTSLSNDVVDKLISLQSFTKALRNSLKWSGLEKVILPMTSRLILRLDEDEHAINVVELLLSDEKVPREIVILASRALLQAALSGPQLPSGDHRLHFLSSIRQRHPDVLRTCIEQIAEEDTEKGQIAEKLILGLSMSGAGSIGDIILAASDADVSVRSAAVRDVLQKMASGGIEEEETTALQNTLKTRLLEETNSSVLDAVYSSPSVIVPLFTSAPSLVTSITSSMTAQQSPRTIIRTHLGFLGSQIYNSQPEMGTQIILTLVLPYGLFSKPRHRTAATVWCVICSSPLGGHALLKGVKEIVEEAMSSEVERCSLDADRMAEVNVALTSKIAANFQASNDFESLLTWITSSSQPGSVSSPNDPHLRVFSTMIGRALLRSLAGQHQVRFAQQLLDAVIGNGYQELDVASETTEGSSGVYDEASFEAALMKSVVLKPNSRTMLQRLQLSTIARIAAIRPSQDMNKHANWLCDEQKDNPDDWKNGSSFMRLMRSAYTCLNTLSSSNNLIFHFNKTLFKNLGSDSLLFLAGISALHVDDSGSSKMDGSIQYIALRHALAFLKASALSEGMLDFQVIVPSLLCALQDNDRRVRTAATECLAALASRSGATPKDLYAFDQVYGSASGSLQYLDFADEVKYLQSLVDHRDHINNDADYLLHVHHETLTFSKSDSKKDTKYKQRILCFLLSHVLCWPSTKAKTALLRSLKEVHSSVKLQMLQPLLRSQLKPGTLLMKEDVVELTTLMLTAFDATSIKDIIAQQSSSWKLLLELVSEFHSLGRPTALWTTLLSRVEGLFPALPHTRQFEICKEFILLGCNSDDTVWGIKLFLRRCIKQASTVTTLLKDLRSGLSETGGRESKRTRLDSTDGAEVNTLSQLSFFVEVLVSHDLPGSLELVAELLEVLSQVVNSSSAPQSDAGYVEQLLMTTIGSAASKIKELPNLSPNAVQLDVLVKLMRTDNPQTFHQALLLMASLANLSSDSVLQNVMPIFTFMGSNVFHRDDSYSFKVIQKTIEGIVPVVTSSLRKKFTNKQDLYIGARDLLKTFTDASTHVPRHRRTNFFIHLVDVMDPADFLAPTCMLLIDKSSSKASRQDYNDAANTLSLPLSILEHYPPSLRISAITNILVEVRRLVSVLKDTNATEKTFLDVISGEDVASIVTIRKRHCQCLTLFIGHGVKQIRSNSNEGSSKQLHEVLTILLDLATTRDEELSGVDLNDIAATSRWSLLRTLEAIPVDEFVSVILTMADNPDHKLRSGSFDLLAERLPEVTATARERIQTMTSQIVTRLDGILSTSQGPDVLESLLKALRSIASTAQPKDEIPLTSIVPKVLQAIRDQHGTCQTMAILPALITKLGPRMIPYLRQTVETCVFVLRKTDRDTSQAVSAEAVSSLVCLINSIPTFWGVQELKAVCELYVDNLFTGSELFRQTEKLVKSLAKRSSSKALLSSLFQIWPSAEQTVSSHGMSRTTRFFELLKRCLHHCSRADALEHLRTLFTHFMLSFDFRGSLHIEDTTLEDSVISAFLELVVKLNENAFQPLFRRSCDWAFGDDTTNERKITFCRMYSALLDLFKELMTPYMTFVIDSFAELLTSFHNRKLRDENLWVACVENISKSFAVDEGVFWRDERIRKVHSHVVQQIPVCVDLKVDGGKLILTECLLGLVECAEDDVNLKSINHAIIMHTRSEDGRVRLFSLECSVAIWQKHGKKLSDFGIETATFISECAEDDNDDIVKECRKLRDAVEAQVGKIEGL